VFCFSKKNFESKQKDCIGTGIFKGPIKILAADAFRDGGRPEAQNVFTPDDKQQKYSAQETEWLHVTSKA